MTRLAINFLFTLICLNGSCAFSYSGVINRNLVFPPDINKYPILFCEFQKGGRENGPSAGAMGGGSRSNDDTPKKINKRIQKYINSFPELEHKLVSQLVLDTFSTTKYKYSLLHRVVEFEGISVSNGAGNFTDYVMYKSVFYFKDRQTDKVYNAYYDTRVHAHWNTNLPLRVPEDKDFFKDLCYYIKRLNTYGAEETAAREQRRIDRYFGD